MGNAQSRLTAQGQISVPAAIRRKLGLNAGSVLEWEERGLEIVVRKAGRHSLAETHLTLFPEGPPKKAAVDTRAAIKESVRRRHARG